MFKKFVLLIGLLIFPFSVHAQTKLQDMPAGLYELDKTHGSIVWKVNHLGLSYYTARFNDFDLEVTLDPEDITKSSFVATIDPTSVETDYPYPEKKDFDKVLAQDKKWFNAGEFPQIKITSTSIRVREDQESAMVDAELDFLGVKKPVSLLIRFNGATKEHPFANVPAIGFSARSRLKRSEWGMNAYIPNIGDDVIVTVEAELHKK